MEFSQYVLNAIASLNSVKKKYDTHAVTLIREAADHAPNKMDSHILDVIGGSSTMEYVAKENVFAPLVRWSDGTRSFAPEDISPEDIGILQSAAQVIKSDYIQTKFAHIVWTLTKDYQYGQLAVSGYLTLFQSKFDPKRWSDCYKQIEAAHQISSAMGTKTDSYKQTCAVISQKLTEMNGSDPSFLSLRLIRLGLKGASKESLLEYDSILNIIARKNLNPHNQNTHLADETISVMEQVCKRLKKYDELKEAKYRYANYYEAQAKSLAHNNDYFCAVIALKKACALYVGVNKEKLLELRVLLEGWQKVALKNMHTQQFEINVKPIYEAIEAMFEGLSVPEAIVQFGRIAKIYNVEDVKKELIKDRDEYVLSSMFGSSLLNEYGQSVEELPPISAVEEDSDSEVFRKHMVRHVAESRDLLDSIPVKIAYQFVRNLGQITEDNLDFLVYDNAIIPDNRSEIIKEGLCLGLNGKLYTAMHILLPQTENIFRHLVKLCGDTVTFLKEDGSEEYKPLSRLFKSEKLRECYDENLIFTFQSIMDEPAGENLRNLNGHGLLEPQVGNGVNAMYFLSLLIMLLSLYGEKSLPIRKDLASRKQSENTGRCDHSNEEDI